MSEGEVAVSAWEGLVRAFLPEFVEKSAFGAAILESPLILLGVLVGLGLVLWIFSGLNREGRRVVELVEKSRGRISDLSAPGRLTWENLDLLERSLPDLSVFREQWAEYREAFVEDDGLAANTLSFRHFLDDEEFLQAVRWSRMGWTFHFPLVRTLPGIATGLGLLGTFLGIAGGLGDLALNQHDAEAVMTSLPEVIGALSSAFVTSILGVLLALYITMWGHRKESHLLDSLYAFREALDRRVPRITSEKLLQASNEQLVRMGRDAEDSRTYLQTIANDMSGKIGEEFDKVLQNHLVPALNAMNEMMRRQMDSVTQESAEVARRFAGEAVGQIAGALRESFDGFNQQIEASANKIEAVSDSLVAVTGLANEAVENQRRLTAETSEAILGAIRQAEKSQEQVDNVQVAAASLGPVLEAMAERQTALQKIQVESTDFVAEATSAMAIATQEYRDAAASLEGLLPKLSASVGTLGQTVAQVADQAESTGSSLESAATRLQERSEREVALISTLGESSREVRQALEDFRPVLQAAQEMSAHLDAARVQLAEERKDLKDRMERAGELETASREALRRLTGGLLEASSSIENASSSIAQVAVGTAKWREEATGAVSKFGKDLQEALRGTLEQYDRSLAQVSTSLASLVREFQETVSEFAATAGGGDEELLDFSDPSGPLS